MTLTEKRLNVVTNGIGWELFSGDGRDVTTSAEGVEQIVITAEETATARRLAERALQDLEVLDAKEQTT